MMTSAIIVLSGKALLALVLLFLGVDAGSRLSHRFAPTAGVAIRLCGSLVVLFWLAEGGFTTLAALGVFRPLPGFFFWLVLDLAARRLEPANGVIAFAWDLRARLGEASRDFKTSDRLLIAATGFVVLIRVLHGLVAPPLAWDTLTYHLVKVARWLQTGAFASWDAPDSNGFYEYFPHGGEVLWAWAMLPFGSDAPLAIAGLVVWLAILVAAFALARELGASPRRSLLVAFCVANVPPVLVSLSSGYVDNVTLAGALLGALFLVRLLRGTAPSEGVLAVAAFAVAASTKFPAVPILVLALAFAGWRLLRSGHGAWIVGCGVAALVSAPPYLRGLVERGSLLWPLQLTAFGRVLVRGNEACALLHSDGIIPNLHFRLSAFMKALFLDVPPHDPLNPGPGAAVLLAMGLGGIVVLLRTEKARRPALVFFLFAAALPVLSIAGHDTIAMRTFWAASAGRFLTISIALLAVSAVALTAPFDALLLLVAAEEALLAFPGGICREEVRPLAELAILAASSGALLVWVARKHPARGPGIAVILLALFAAVVLPLRERLRWPLYQAAVERRAYDLHPLRSFWATVFPVARLLDTPAPVRVAAAAGWNRVGDNWYVYPLFGSRLQNDVVYVPITRDGAVVDYRRGDLVAAGRDRDAWLRRLVEKKVDALVLLAPDPPERAWVDQLPGVFRPILAAAPGLASGFSVDRDAARKAALVTPPASRPGPP